jgi:SAM-dependent methyltransferase
VPASVFFADDEFPPLETRALDLCKGHILDIGAAAGRHSLHLIRRALQVTSLDILPETEAILRDRGVIHVVASDILTFTGERFDTLLMLMNGIGMVGTLDGLDRFLRHAHEITSPSGQIICDSIDVSVTSDPIHSAYRQRNLTLGRQPGHQTFTMTYGETTG